MRHLVLVLLIVLSGCAKRGELMIYPEAAEVELAERRVFVGTTRKLVRDTLRFDGKRSDTLTLARYDISIPPGHKTGAIEWPKPNRQPDPMTDFLTTDQQIYPTGGRFRSDLAQALRQTDGTATIFVHGFNNTFSEGLYRIAQLSYDLKLPGVAMHYSWPSAASPFGYVYDKDSAAFARDGLEQLLRETEAAGAKRIIIVAHSMGSWLTMETLRQIAIRGNRGLMGHVAGVILISPDVDVDVFRKQARDVGDLPQPFIIFGSPKDKALRLSAFLTGQNDRLGSITSVDQVANLKVTYLDVEAFSVGTGHFDLGDNPALIQIVSRIVDVEQALGAEAQRVGLLDGAVMTVRNATQIVLSPVQSIAEELSN